MSEQSKRVTADGTDITEGVQILYDIAHSSMDWGSGFLDSAEMEKVIALAVFMGWEVPSLPDNSPGIHAVARKFPDQYEFVERIRTYADPQSGNPREFTDVRVKVKGRNW